MQALLAGRSALALFPTSAGKSLCYQLPALLMDGVTLVISPLIALMKDQVEALRARGIAAARLDSSLSLEESQRVFDDMKSGALKLLYIAPERLCDVPPAGAGREPLRPEMVRRCPQHPFSCLACAHAAQRPPFPPPQLLPFLS